MGNYMPSFGKVHTIKKEESVLSAKDKVYNANGHTQNGSAKNHSAMFLKPSTQQTVTQSSKNEKKSMKKNNSIGSRFRKRKRKKSIWAEEDPTWPRTLSPSILRKASTNISSANTERSATISEANESPKFHHEQFWFEEDLPWSVRVSPKVLEKISRNTSSSATYEPASPFISPVLPPTISVEPMATLSSTSLIDSFTMQEFNTVCDELLAAHKDSTIDFDYHRYKRSGEHADATVRRRRSLKADSPALRRFVSLLTSSPLLMRLSRLNLNEDDAFSPSKLNRISEQNRCPKEEEDEQSSGAENDEIPYMDNDDVFEAYWLDKIDVGSPRLATMDELSQLDLDLDCPSSETSSDPVILREKTGNGDKSPVYQSAKRTSLQRFWQFIWR